METYSDLGRTPAIASPNPWGSVEPSLRTTGLEQKMANRNVFETMQAELYTLMTAIMFKSLQKMVVSIIRAILYYFHGRTLILTQLKKNT